MVVICTGRGFIATSESEAEKLITYDILTNPNNCSTAWLPKSHALLDQSGDLELKISSDPDKVTSFYVGRGDFEEKLLAGHVDSSSARMRVAISEERVGILIDYEVLVSYSPGFKVLMKDFDMERLQSTMDFAGMDELHNFGESEIKLTVSHRKAVETFISVLVTKNSGWGITAEVEAEIKYDDDMGNKLSMKGGLDVALDWENKETDAYSSYDLVDLQVIRELTVHKYTAVQVQYIIIIT